MKSVLLGVYSYPLLRPICHAYDNQSGSHYVHNTGYNNIYIQIGHKHQISSYKYNMCIRDMCLFNSKKLFIMSMSILFNVPFLHSFSNTFLSASLCVRLFPRHNYMFKVVTGYVVNCYLTSFARPIDKQVL